MFFSNQPLITTNNNDLFMIYIFVKAGSIYEDETNRGVSHALEHMLFKSSSHFSKDEILQNLTRFGGVYNAVTNKDITYYYIKTQTKYWKNAMKIIFSMLFTPKLLHSEWQIEKKVVIEEVSKHDDGLYDKILLSLYPITHAYTKTVGATAMAVDKLTIDHLRQYYNNQYTNPNNISIAINCDKKYVNLVKKYLETLNNSRSTQITVPSRFIIPRLDPIDTKIVYEEKLSEKEIVLVFPSYDIKDWKKQVILNTLNYILGQSGIYSLLMYELREKRGLVYGISCSSELSDFMSITQIKLSTESKDIASLLTLIRKIINKVKTQGIDDKALNLYKESYSSLIKYTKSDNQSVFFANALKYHYGIQSYTSDDVLSIIKTIKCDDIKRCAFEIYNFQKMGLYVCGKYKKSNILQSYPRHEILKY